MIGEDGDWPSIKLIMEMTHRVLNRHQFPPVCRIPLLLGLQRLRPERKRPPGSVDILIQRSSQRKFGCVTRNSQRSSWVRVIQRDSPLEQEFSFFKRFVQFWRMVPNEFEGRSFRNLTRSNLVERIQYFGRSSSMRMTLTRF